MTLEELVANARVMLDDLSAPYGWSDGEIKLHLNEGYNEACERAMLLVDSQSTMCSVAYQAAQSLVALDQRIIFPRRIKDRTAGIVLPPRTLRQADQNDPEWQSLTGAPEFVITDYQANSLWLVPTPVTEGHLDMVVIRFPLVPLSDAPNPLPDPLPTPLPWVPEIRPDLHIKLLYWVLYRCYLKPDTDLFDKDAASDSLAQFEQEFGKKGPVGTTQDTNAMFNVREYRTYR